MVGVVRDECAIVRRCMCVCVMLGAIGSKYTACVVCNTLELLKYLNDEYFIGNCLLCERSNGLADREGTRLV